jgi:hypothetical protein
MSEIQRTPQDGAIQVILNEYQNNSTIRLLIGILAALSSPVGGFISAFDGAITAKIEDMRNKRTKLFFEELSRGSYELTEELIRQEDISPRVLRNLQGSSEYPSKGKDKTLRSPITWCF